MIRYDNNSGEPKEDFFRPPTIQDADLLDSDVYTDNCTEARPGKSTKANAVVLNHNIDFCSSAGVLKCARMR